MIRWIVLIVMLHLMISLIASVNSKDSALTIVEDNLKDKTEEIDDDDNDIEDENIPQFQPSNSWQKIKPGQTIPTGLHVRINLQTGEKEAKLLNPNENEEIPKDEKFQYYQIKDGNEDAIKAQNQRLQELKNLLKSLKTEDSSPSENEVKRVHTKFRDIEELKKEFAKINLAMKTDSEIILELLKEYPKANNEKKINILQDIEYLVHQYDNAQLFIKMKGLELILPDFNSTNSRLRAYVAFVIGSAMQGNPPVQIAVFETHIMQQLLRLLIYDTKDEVQLRVLYAISCLLRQFPLAQERFMDNGGLIAFAELFKQNTLQSSKLQIKAVTLLHDLVTEKQLTEQHATKDRFHEEKLRQYQSLNIQDGIVQYGFCELIPKLLRSPDYDTQEKVVRAMLSFVDSCYHQFHEHLDVLRSLLDKYQESSMEETLSNSQLDGSDYYFTNLYNLVQELTAKIQLNTKDEL